MCGDAAPRRAGWQGWSAVPAATLGEGGGAWIDISHVITEDLARSPMFPRPRISRLYEQPRDQATVTEIQMVCHHGTHVDAPRHFIIDGPTFDHIPLDRLYGAGIVLNLPCAELATIDATMLESAGGGVEAGDIVLLHTGWAERIGTDSYERHPFLSPDGVNWLLARGVKMLGVDFSTPDLGAAQRPPDYDFPAHYGLLSHGVLIAEHVANLKSLAGRRIDAIFLPLAIKGADGGPARAMARAA